MIYNLQQAPGRTALVNGLEYLFFSGYSYLGMSHVPEFVHLVKKGFERFGTLHPSSRISNTRSVVYEKFEEQLSQLTGYEETVTFSSGYLAGRAIIDAMVKNKERCFIAPDTHPALQSDGIILQKHWKKTLIQAINESKETHFFLLTDSVNPLKACINDFNFFNDLQADKHLTCIVDDSHGIGYLGLNGQGISHSLPALSNVDFILSYSLSKALNLNGGAVSCSRDTARMLRRLPYYSASTAISPACAYAFLEGRQLYEEQQKKLLKNIDVFTHLLKDIPGIISHPLLPVFLLKDEFDQSLFHPHQIIISSFSYPDPAGVRINRIVLNALHTIEDMERTAWLLQEITG